MVDHSGIEKAAWRASYVEPCSVELWEIYTAVMKVSYLVARMVFEKVGWSGNSMVLRMVDRKGK